MLKNINLRSLTNSQDTISISGAATYSQSGWSVSSIGDFNNDGYDDMIIGAPSASSGADYDSYTITGQSYIVYGTSSFTNINLAHITEVEGFSIYLAYEYPTYSAKSGYSVRGAGDINNDGYSDIIIGAPLAGSAGSNMGVYGESYVVYGTATLLSSINLANLTAAQGFSIIGLYGCDNEFGYSVSGAGDINNDGYSDIIIGARQASSIGNYVGAYVVYGQRSFPDTVYLANITITQGFYTYGAGDINGDGYDDVIIGYVDSSSCSASSGNGCDGSAYVIYGNKSLPVAINLKKIATDQYGFSMSGEAYSSCGYSVSSAGDMNNDGYGDVIIGAPYANSNEEGASYIVYGKYSMSYDTVSLIALTTTQGFTVNGDYAGSYLGLSVDNAGDVNNDGYDDIIIGATSPELEYLFSGAVYVIYGATSISSTINLADLTATQGFSIIGDYAYGYSVSGAGDINKDGYDDLIIGVPDVEPCYEAICTGSTYVVYGSSDSSESDDSSSTSTTDDIGLITGIAIGGAAVLGITGYALYAYTHDFWPFVGESLASKAADHIGDTAL